MSSTPHDALFKAVFSQVEHAAGVLRAVLPPALVARLDLATLALCPGSFVDEALSQRHTDLLFSVALDGHTAWIHVLVEHQSTVDPLMPFRLLRYMVRIWEGHLADHPRATHLPAIFPVVLHHGEVGWRASVAFEELLALDPDTLEAVADHVVRFRFVLDDVSAEADEALKARAMTALGRLALWCLKHSRRPDDLVRGLSSWLDLVREVRRAPNGPAALAVIWRYIFTLSEPLRPQELLAFLERAAGNDGKEEIVTLAEYLEEEGRKKGVLDGQRKVLLTLLDQRFGALPQAAVARINAAKPTQLELWTERVLTAPTLADVLGAS